MTSYIMQSTKNQHKIYLKARLEIYEKLFLTQQQIVSVS